MKGVLDPWGDLDSFLSALAQELGGDGYVFYDSASRQLLPFVEDVHLLEKLGRVRDMLTERFGVDFLRRGTGKRYLSEAEPLFVCQPVLGAYLFVVLLQAPRIESSLVLGLLESVEVQLTEMVRCLPPIDGGPAAVSQRP